jgi:hypothetical protein
MTVIVLVKQKLAVRCEIEQPLDRFHVPDFGFIELDIQCPVLKDAGRTNIQANHQAEDTDIPKG